MDPRSPACPEEVIRVLHEVRVPLDRSGPVGLLGSPFSHPGRLMLWKDMGCQPKNNGNFFHIFSDF